MIGERRHAIGRGLEQLDEAGMGVAALALRDDGAHTIPGHAAGHEHDVTAVVHAGDALTAEGERVDRQLELLAAIGSRRSR